MSVTTTITPFTKSPSRQNPATFSADMDDRLSEENSRIVESYSGTSWEQCANDILTCLKTIDNI